MIRSFQAAGAEEPAYAGVCVHRRHVTWDEYLAAGARLSANRTASGARLVREGGALPGHHLLWQLRRADVANYECHPLTSITSKVVLAIGPYPGREETLLHLNGQVHHGKRAVPLRNYVIVTHRRGGELQGRRHGDL